jgi:hypothetical protein
MTEAEPELAYISPTEAVYYARSFRIPYPLPSGVNRVTVTPCERDYGLWRIVYQFGGNYEMDSSMRVRR